LGEKYESGFKFPKIPENQKVLANQKKKKKKREKCSSVDQCNCKKRRRELTEGGLRKKVPAGVWGGRVTSPAPTGKKWSKTNTNGPHLPEQNHTFEQELETQAASQESGRGRDATGVGGGRKT